MAKLTFLLALYAAGVCTWLLLAGPAAPGGSATTSGPDARRDARFEPDRILSAAARDRLRDEIKDILKNVDWRLARLDALRAALEDGLVATQKAAEDAAQGSYNKLEVFDESLRGLREQLAGLGEVAATLKALEARVAEVEARPAQVVREPGATPVPTSPTKPPGDEPRRPVLPTEPAADPAQVKAEIEKARADIQSDALPVLFPAIEKIREHRVLEAVPRLLEILAGYQDEFGRTAAAAALGDMQVCDAVLGLGDALTDKSDLVAQQANKSLRQITGFDTQMSASARIRERRAARGRFKEWWAKHESEVRERLGQPASGER